MISRLKVDMSSPCIYKDSLGVPGMGVHAKRLLGMARFDIIGTIVLAHFTTRIFNIDFLRSFIYWTLLAEFLFLC